MNSDITAVIISKNEEQMLENCLRSIKSLAKEILVIDNNSTDQTALIAENLAAKVISIESPSFSRLRNEALKYVKTGWVFYIDADERVTPSLATEIINHINSGQTNSMTFQRENYCYGHHLKHGGWQNDFVTRLFKTDNLKKWQGNIHESPIYIGGTNTASNPLIHLTHRNTVQNLKKSADWTIMEARLLAKSGIEVNVFTIIRKSFMEFFRRVVLKAGYKDGMVGWIEAFVQGMNRAMVYIQVWEEQNKPSLPEKYQAIEDRIKKSWRDFQQH
ncbi:MAG: glycosyltransferase family 2 protein [Patescibacteria group bacterium]